MSVSPEDMNLHYLNFIAASALGKKKERKKAFLLPYLVHNHTV